VREATSDIDTSIPIILPKGKLLKPIIPKKLKARGEIAVRSK